MAIGDSAARDDALSKLAIAAAEGKDAATARGAVKLILNSTVKDQTAHRTALRLAKEGLAKDANVVAGNIGDSAIRDQTLAKIAKGEFSESAGATARSPSGQASPKNARRPPLTQPH